MKAIILSQAKLNGSTGPIHFNEYGKRKGRTELEILNLRNNSFQKVSNDFLNSYVHEVVCETFISPEYNVPINLTSLN